MLLIKMGLDDSLEKEEFNVNDTVELENHDGILWDLDKKLYQIIYFYRISSKIW